MRYFWTFYVFALACLLAVFTSDCKSASSPSVDPRALARGTVETLETVWNVSANACVDVAVAEESKTTLQTCQKVLDPARTAIVAAADMVDTWTDADQKNFPCAIADAMAGLTQIQATIASQGPLPQVVADGFSLAKMYTPQCVRPDGGP